MRNQKRKSAFTMIELVFVIVIIGILASVAVPKLAATRDDAEITKARTLVVSVRNALAMERQKRILRGEFRPITAVGDATNVFGNFSDANGDTGVAVLEYPVASTKHKHKWYWSGNNGWYGYCLNNTCRGNGDAIWFKVENGKFACKELADNYGDCSMLGLTPE